MGSSSAEMDLGWVVAGKLGRSQECVLTTKQAGTSQGCTNRTMARRPGESLSHSHELL